MTALLASLCRQEEHIKAIGVYVRAVQPHLVLCSFSLITDILVAEEKVIIYSYMAIGWFTFGS
jgi:hypothetical protein